MGSPLRVQHGLGHGLLIGAILAVAALSEAQGLNGTSAAIGPPVVDADYTIGADDVLTIAFWGEKDMSGDVIVRPDGKITLPLINDVVAAGLSPEQLRVRVAERAAQFFQNAQATVIVKEINSRRVFITGQVEKPGAYPLTTRTTVIQLIALAGGLKEFARSSRIVIMRNTAGRDVHLMFDFRAVVEGKNPDQNVEVRPGDTVVVP